MSSTADRLRERCRAFAELQAHPCWPEFRQLLADQRQRNLEAALDGPQPRVFYQGYAAALLDVEGAVDAGAERHRTEADPEALARDQTRLVADVLRASPALRTGRGGLA